MDISLQDMLQVGVISSTHGIRGEVKVFPTTDDIRRFEDLKNVFLDTGSGLLEMEISGVKFFRQFAILKFRGLDSINDVEKYKGKGLLVPRENAVKLNKDEYFISDLIGMQVEEDTGRELGTLRDVLKTGANDVYEVELKDGGTVLIPAIKQCILRVDVEANYMLVHLLEGLL